MARAGREAVAVAILAKAPLPGFAKTRLAAALGADGAAALQARLIARATDSLGRTQPVMRDHDRGTYMINHLLPIEVEVK